MAQNWKAELAGSSGCIVALVCMTAIVIVAMLTGHCPTPPR